MKLDSTIRRIADLHVTWAERAFAVENGPALDTRASFMVEWDGGVAEEPRSVTIGGDEGSWDISADFEGLRARISYALGPGGFFVDEVVHLAFERSTATLKDLAIGLKMDRASLKGFIATPIPFRIGLDGKTQVLDLDEAVEGKHLAEGWVLDNGEDGLLVMRVPSGSAYTCFVPLEIKGNELSIGGVDSEGDKHASRNVFLDTAWESGAVDLPKTRYVFFKGDWRTGYSIFRRMVDQCIPRLAEPRRKPCPVTYNTFHDFGPTYDRAGLVELMPLLSEMGFGLIHLDPGWETAFGSNVWNDSVMGTPESFVTEANKHGLKVGCWTAVHTRDSEVHGDDYLLNQKGEKYLAEDFTVFSPTAFQLWGVCPLSSWRDSALANLSRLGKAGFVFLNSDFHDWPWSGDSCWSKDHYHKEPITRAQWAEALSDFYERLHSECPDLVIEMHDHVESGEYRTPVWYMFDRPNSYDEKWAYEFMWTTYQDLMDRKLFALYYLRLAEPIPLFLHINASSDNENALAFWYVASCVTHIGVGAVRGSGDVQRSAYKNAIQEYNARFEAFALGAFYGIDEVTHVHVYPDKCRAVILAFNLEDEPMEREFEIDPEAWEMEPGALVISGADPRHDGSKQYTKVLIPARGVALVDVAAS